VHQRAREVEPRVLFLDEPTTGLDPKSRRDIWNEVRRLNLTEGVTVFLTTQYMEEADTLAGRLAVIDDGRIVTEGTPERLKAEIGADVVHVAIDRQSGQAAVQAVEDMDGLQQSSLDEATLTLFVSAGPQRLAEILRRLDRGGVAIGAVTMSRPSLDDAFLRATGHRLDA
jgi:ABC-2 type transport system ATP-binding protein